MKILVIRFSSIGDILMTTPVLRCLKQQVKDAEIHFLTKKKFHFVLQNNPYVDRFFLLEESLDDIIKKLKKENYNYLIDLHHNLRTLLVKTALRKKTSSYYKANIEKWLMVKFKINRLPKQGTVERFLNTISFLGVHYDGKGLDYFLQADYSLPDMLPASHQQNYIGFVIGGSVFTRRMPIEKIAAIIQKLEQPVVLLGGPGDKQRGDDIVKLTGQQVYNTCGLFSFDQSAFLVKKAQQIITHDTSLMHVAAAFNKKIISVWGHNIPAFGNYPFEVKESYLVGVEGLYCRPCSKNGTAQCPQKHFSCMWKIDEEYVANIANKE